MDPLFLQFIVRGGIPCFFNLLLEEGSLVSSIYSKRRDPLVSSIYCKRRDPLFLQFIVRGGIPCFLPP